VSILVRGYGILWPWLFSCELSAGYAETAGFN
jgi:hypothetical protein